jgi:long-subunit fatty acid transport protein
MATVAILFVAYVRRLPVYLAILAILLVGTRVSAGPLDDAHVADTGFSGPTTGDLTAVYWNPAGLGLLRGPQVMLGGAWQSTNVSVNRTSIDPATGSSPGTRTFPQASGNGTQHPFRWPPGPGGFFAIGAGIGRRFGIALALFAPYSSSLDIDASSGGEEPTRYHLVRMRFDHTALATGLAIHASDSIQFGVAPGFLFPSAHLVFDEDTGLGRSSVVEDPAMDMRYDLASNGLISPLYYFSLGAHYRRGRLSLGLAYTSAPLGTGGLVALPMDDTKIVPQGDGVDELCVSPAPQACLSGQLRYRLPAIFTLGATWELNAHWSATGIVRWLRYSTHDKVTVLVLGPTNQTALGDSVPDHVVLYRGFSDSFDVRGRAVYTNKHFRMSGTLRVETSAVPKSHVNAAAIDGLKLEPQIAVEMRVWRQIRLSVSYAFAYMLPVDTGASVFDPQAASACTASGSDLSNPACRARQDGQARPSAAGSYSLWRQALSVHTSFGF